MFIFVSTIVKFDILPSSKILPSSFDWQQILLQWAITQKLAQRAGKTSLAAGKGSYWTEAHLSKGMLWDPGKLL